MIAYQARYFPSGNISLEEQLTRENSNKVFVVHDHDNGAKQEMVLWINIIPYILVNL